MVKKIKFTIDENGEVAVSVEGAVGSECDKLTAPFEALLGPVAVKEYKDTYFLEGSETVNAAQENEHG